MACEHKFHLVELESVNDNYIENDKCCSRKREERNAIFVCELCGYIKKVVTKGVE